MTLGRKAIARFRVNRFSYGQSDSMTVEFDHRWNRTEVELSVMRTSENPPPQSGFCHLYFDRNLIGVFNIGDEYELVKVEK